MAEHCCLVSVANNLYQLNVAATKIRSIRLSREEEAMLEARRVARGLATITATLRELIVDPTPRLFPLFDAGKSFGEIVAETGLGSAAVRACYADYERGLTGPPDLPHPVKVAKIRLQQTEVRAAAQRDAEERRTERRRDEAEARRQREDARLRAQAAREEEAHRLERFRILNEPYKSPFRP